MNSVLCIIQARCSSTRLPSKVLKNLNGDPMFIYQIKRVLGSKKIDKLVVATSTSSDDDPIEKLCSSINVDCYRGSLDNVLSRFYEAAKVYRAKYIVRLTADCPLIDASIIDRCIEKIIASDFDYVSNCHDRTFADGMDVETFTFKALNAAYRYASLQSEQEHVTPYIWENPHLFSLGSIFDEEDLSSLRLTVDHQEDFQLIEKIVHHFNDIGNKNFSYEDIKHYFHNNPEVVNVNKQYSCNEGYAKSVANDEEGS